MTKGLEALEKIKTQSLNVIEVDKCLSIIEKELRVLEIIKTKNVDISYFRRCRTVFDYNEYFYAHDKLMKSEFDLLLEVL